MSRLEVLVKQCELWKERAEKAEAERDAALADIRAIELAIDGLNTKAFTQKPQTQAALDRIKARCRSAINPSGDKR